MKTIKLHFLLPALLFLIPVLIQAQDQNKEKSKKSNSTSLTFVSSTAKLTKVHTREELEKMGKIELTKIYMERISILTELAPFIALHTQPGATLEDMGIPQTPENTDHLEKEVKNKEEYLKSVKDTLDDIIPYADKGNIIWAILFYEEMIQKMQEQK